MNKKRKQQIYLAAAERLAAGELLDTGGGACCAIAEVVFPSLLQDSADRANGYQLAKNLPVLEDFELLFAPGAVRGGYWGERWGEGYEERKACRVLALCFMAAIMGAK